MKSIVTFISITVFSISLYALERDTQFATPSIKEMSQGFASYFSSDKLVQNFISGLLSPFIIIVFIFFAAYIIYRIIKYFDSREKQKKLYIQHLILLKAKEKGLSNYQIKILREITELLRRGEAIRVMEEPLIYEKYIKHINSAHNTLETTCRDIISIYEKIYNGNDIRRPLSSLSEIGRNTLLAVSSEKKEWFICKIKRIESDSLILLIIHTPAEKEIHFISGEYVNVIFFRGGDAEYRFTSSIINNEDLLLKLNLPDKFERGEQVPLPLINVNLVCEISKPGVAGEEKVLLEAGISKLNEAEAVIRLNTKLKHDNGNEINFQISGFLIHAEIKVIGEKHIPEQETYYYNVQFLNISDAAKKVIYTFLENSLFDI